MTVRWQVPWSRRWGRDENAGRGEAASATTTALRFGARCSHRSVDGGGERNSTTIYESVTLVGLAGAGSRTKM
jgi:hypothetical protein